MKSLILPFSFLMKSLVLSLLFFVTAAPSVIDNTRAVGLQKKENNVGQDYKDQSGASDFMKLGDIKGEVHQSDMNKKNQAVEDRYRKVGGGVLINTESPKKGKPGSTDGVWTTGSASSIKDQP
tara:strand:+ start:63 stop:431 length:369 start_codon:yes stop_codon:yes gene_type:complete